MAYTINKSDGSILTTVPDGQVDSFSTDITLIGRNYSGFGESLNENLIKLLENFSDTSEPERPIKGQIWFDSSELKLKVYTGASFVPVSSATISSTQPTNLGVGDLWFDDTARQLFFFDGTTPILLAPAYSASQQLSGFVVRTVLDSINSERVITILYTNGILLGIFSKDSFILKSAIEGYGPAGTTISPGFNQGTISGFKFDVTSTNSDALGGEPAAKYLRTDIDNQTTGLFTITSNRGILIGSGQQAQIAVRDNGNVELRNNQENANLSIRVQRGDAADDAISINTSTQTLSIYGVNPSSQVNIGGSLTVNGDLTIQGTTTTINTETLNIEDKNIILGYVGDSSAGDDTLANGGGITLRGSSDHNLQWDNAVDSGAWVSTENFVLETGKKFYIKNDEGEPVEVLSFTQLGETVAAIPGVTRFGAQTILEVGPILSEGSPPTPFIEIEENTISTVNALAPNLRLLPLGEIELVGSPRITGLADPFAAQDASTKEYVDNRVENRALVFSMDISDAISNAGIEAILNQLAPPDDFREGTVARVLCTSLSNSSASLNINSYLSTSAAEFITPDSPGSTTPGGTASAITNVTFSSATVPAQGISVFRTIKTFRIDSSSGSKTWKFVS